MTDYYLKQRTNMKKTRTFSFPNAGHSVRKLNASLRDLGDTLVSINYEETGFDDFDIWYEENPNGIKASILADVMQTLGTRFTYQLSNNQLSVRYYTKAY